MDTGVVEVKGTMEQVEAKNSWLLLVQKALQRRNITQATLEHDLDLPHGWLRKVKEGTIKGVPLNTYLRIWEYLECKVKIIDQPGKFVREELTPKMAADLSSITVAGQFIDMSSLYASRDRALRELTGLSDSYSTWGVKSHSILQIAADNIMLINILENLFHYAKRKG